MARIIINLSKENIQNLLHDKDITVGSGSATSQLAVSIASEEIHVSFFNLIEEKIHKMNHDCNYRTAETYIAAYKKLRLFREEKDQLRAVYNQAVEQGLTIDLHPFRRVYTGIAKTSKRAITINDLKRIKKLNLDDPMLEYARDMFLFSFYTRGMAFVDMAYLKKSDVSGNVLTYRRKKTGQQLTIRWERSMQEIAQRYPSKSGYYLLPIIHTHNGKERNQYRHVQTLINESLKTVGEMAKINHKLTMYVARHSWASIARQMGVPLNVISHGMGHSNEKTTEIYLKSVDMTIVDEANRNIMQQLDI